MKLIYKGKGDLRLSPSEKRIRPGDVIEDEALVALCKGHPQFEELRETKPKKAKKEAAADPFPGGES